MKEAQFLVVPDGVIVEAENGLWTADRVLEDAKVATMWPIVGRLFDVHTIAKQLVKRPPRARGDWRITNIGVPYATPLELRSPHPRDVAKALILHPGIGLLDDYERRALDVHDIGANFFVVSFADTFEPLYELRPSEMWSD
jgi:hypothetical protein